MKLNSPWKALLWEEMCVQAQLSLYNNIQHIFAYTFWYLTFLLCLWIPLTSTIFFCRL
jgi:hypothetical protein